MWRCLALLVATSGCSLILPGDDDPLEPGIDAGDVDAPRLETYEPWQLDPFDVDELVGMWEPSSGCVVNTDNPGGQVTFTPECGDPPFVDETAAHVVVRAEVIRVLESVRIVGDRPLILLAANLRVDGELRVDRTVVDNNTDPGCDAMDAQAGDGAAGGGFGRAGGASPTAPASSPINVGDLMGLRSGCAGGAVELGMRADGGGGLQLVAADTLDVDGTILANGRGGVAGANGGGGGGGGSGGMIVLDATSIIIGPSARIAANGGGGGSGGPDSGGGAPGGEVALTECALGGVDAQAGDGGRGGCGGGAAQPGFNSNGSEGDGGGGGGVGFILLHGYDTMSADAVLSPGPTDAP